MNLEIFIKPRSESDLLEAFKFYDEQSSGLGDEFIRCVDAKLEFISRNPNTCPKLYKDFHRGSMLCWQLSWPVLWRLSWQR
ncbi:MAG: hypothetical protein UZ01_01368 [Candidatus Brocadia sinica]|nr:MAG: hypothetical protein UZ01_01368 [Candidatus Brocadia sinica]